MTPKKPANVWRPAFIEVLTETGNVSYAADQAGVTRQAAYLARDRSARFAKQWDDAMERATDALEKEARRRAYEGTREPDYYKGEVVGHTRKFSDTLMIFLLKAHRPKKFREQYSHEHSGPDGTPLRVVWEEGDPAPLGDDDGD